MLSHDDQIGLGQVNAAGDIKQTEARSHLAIEHALLFETQILGGVGHNGEGGFGVMPERKERQSIFYVRFIIQRMSDP